MEEFLKKIAVVNEDGTLSVTNSVVLVFCFITAFRSLFAGSVIELPVFTWKIESLDLASTLPLLFSLVNYSHRRMEQSKIELNKKEKEE